MTQNINNIEPIDIKKIEKVKICEKCKKEFIVTGNYHKYCSKCKKGHIKEYLKEYQKRGYVILKNIANRQTDNYKKKKKESDRRYYEENKKRIKKYNNGYYLKNNNRIKENVKKWESENREKVRINGRNRRRRYRVRKLKAEGFHTEQDWIKKKEEYGYKCFYCGIKESDLKNKYMKKSQQKLHEDHYIPLAKGGSDYIYNIVPACVSCNTSKSDKINI